MNQKLFSKFALLARGTFLEEDRDSNFPSENTVPQSYKGLCEELVNIRDEVTRMNSKPSSPMNLKRLSIQLPNKLHQEVKLIAHLEKETITSVTIKLLSKYAEDKRDLLSTIQLNNERI